MKLVDRASILNLYKALLKYGESLTYTDKSFYKNYIRKEFWSVNIGDEQKIQLLFEVHIV